MIVDIYARYIPPGGYFFYDTGDPGRAETVNYASLDVKNGDKFFSANDCQHHGIGT